MEKSEMILTLQLLIPKEKNSSGMNVVISAGAKIRMTEEGNFMVIPSGNNQCVNIPLVDTDSCKTIWNKALKQELKALSLIA